VDQTTLDASPTLQYKKANGTISGNIVADKNVYQNYFLVLKADNPCQVVVKTVKKEIQPKLPHPAPVQVSAPPPVPRVIAQPKSKWKMIAIIIVIVGGGALLYYLYKQSSNKVEAASPSANTTDTVTVPSLEAHVPPAASTESTSSPLPNGGLLDRLKNLAI